MLLVLCHYVDLEVVSCGKGLRTLDAFIWVLDVVNLPNMIV